MTMEHRVNEDVEEEWPRHLAEPGRDLRPQARLAYRLQRLKSIRSNDRLGIDDEWKVQTSETRVARSAS
jgi:hypothetical protein